MELLKKLCHIAAPSGHERPLRDFIIDYVRREASGWRVVPEILADETLQDCLVLAFGQPRTATFAHLDSVGFSARYDNHLVPIGSPAAPNGTLLVGNDATGPFETRLVTNPASALCCADLSRPIAPGTALTYHPDFRLSDEYVQCCYLDNRLGVWNALRVAETLTDGLICFSCYEEHGGGTVPMLARLCYERYGIRQALISDITWVTEGVHHGAGVAISLRDRHLPRRVYLDHVLTLADRSGVPYQIEVEGNGSSDGRELHMSPYPIDWCFVGAPEAHAHTPNERVHRADIDAMLRLYQYLMEHL